MNKELTVRISDSLADIIALLLLEKGAVKINIVKPFTLASGNLSPVYVNCREIISDPLFMQLFVAAAGIILKRSGVNYDIVAGGETAGIPVAAYLAQCQFQPMVYVRKAPKGYGLSSQIEGGAVAGKRVLLVEDLITDAGSKINFINALRSAGATVTDTLVLFDRQQGGREKLSAEGVQLHSVTTLSALLNSAGQAGILSDTQLVTVQRYLADPQRWNETRGAEFAG